jgi:cation diffusion facilitator family transporter
MAATPISDWLDRLTPTRLLQASVLVALVTIAMKTAAWALTDSVGLLSDALESLVNLASAVFGLWMVTVAARPPDEEHPFGHHKAEYFSSGFEGVLIIAAAVGIAGTALHRLVHPVPVTQLGLGLLLSVLSSALNGALAWAMFHVARRERSIALEADAHHLVIDVWTSAGVIAGVAMVVVTGWHWLDALVAMAVAANIAREGARLMWRSVQGLMDEAVEPEVLATIRDTLARFVGRGGGPGLIRFDHLLTRRSGQRRYASFHLHLPAGWTLRQAAALRAEVEMALMQAVPGLHPTIQMLPSDVEAHVDDPREMP